ncbi:hypothetical protein OTU49_012900 [Cherax quadricarinatus]|uniref:Uncharacterized protein n=1 Tax=Cherax quadricarinatus TaxID=27406 RepID=A0AAW0VVP4_CHEQU
MKLLFSFDFIHHNKRITKTGIIHSSQHCSKYHPSQHYAPRKIIITTQLNATQLPRRPSHPSQQTTIIHITIFTIMTLSQQKITINHSTRPFTTHKRQQIIHHNTTIITAPGPLQPTRDNKSSTITIQSSQHQALYNTQETTNHPP